MEHQPRREEIFESDPRYRTYKELVGRVAYLKNERELIEERIALKRLLAEQVGQNGSSEQFAEQVLRETHPKDEDSLAHLEFRRDKNREELTLAEEELRKAELDINIRRN